MPDPFSTLPLPLPLMILDAIEDFATLGYLLQSSSAANIIFEEFYCEIAEAVLSNLAPQLQRLLRTIVYIRSDRLAIGSQLTSSEALDSFLSDRVLNDSVGAKPLSNATVSLAAVRSLTTSASHVQQAAASFFEEFLDRVNNIKPSYLPDNTYDPRTHRSCLFEKEYRANLPEGWSYEPLKCGLASWIEEQRVCRALWRVQLYFDLATITRPRLDAASQAWTLLSSLGPHRIWGKLKNSELGEMDCVYDFLWECFDTKSMPSSHRSHLSELPATDPKSLTAAKSMPYHDQRAPKRDHPVEQLDRPSPAVCRLGAILYSRFKPLQRLGIHIWDRKRMAGLGLIKVRRSEKYLAPIRNPSSEFEFYFKWNSLLAKDWKNEMEQ